MAVHQFTKAVDLYTIAIALSDDDKQDIQYCNRYARKALMDSIVRKHAATYINVFDELLR